MMAPFLGLKEILFTPQITSTKAILLDTSIAGTIADERPDASEKWVSYDPGPGFAPIYVKVEDVGRPAVHKASSPAAGPRSSCPSRRPSSSSRSPLVMVT
jgi:hypothetical protein